jgi:hypothetical protein
MPAPRRSVSYPQLLAGRRQGRFTAAAVVKKKPQPPSSTLSDRARHARPWPPCTAGSVPHAEVPSPHAQSAAQAEQSQGGSLMQLLVIYCVVIVHRLRSRSPHRTGSPHPQYGDLGHAALWRDVGRLAPLGPDRTTMVSLGMLGRCNFPCCLGSSALWSARAVPCSSRRIGPQLSPPRCQSSDSCRQDWQTSAEAAGSCDFSQTWRRSRNYSQLRGQFFNEREEPPFLCNDRETPAWPVALSSWEHPKTRTNNTGGQNACR